MAEDAETHVERDFKRMQHGQLEVSVFTLRAAGKCALMPLPFSHPAGRRSWIAFAHTQPLAQQKRRRPHRKDGQIA